MQTTGCDPSCVKPGLRHVPCLLVTQRWHLELASYPFSRTKAANWSTVTWSLPTANGLPIVTTCCGPSSLLRSFSPSGDPIVNDPAGTTTISGQSAHSRNVSLGFSPRSCAAVSGAAHRDANETVTGPLHGSASAGFAASAGRTGSVTATL